MPGSRLARRLPGPLWRLVTGGPVAAARRVLRRLARSADDPFARLRNPDSRLVAIPDVVADPGRDADPAFVVLLPSLDIGRLTGGPNTAINLGVRLAKRGVKVRFTATQAGAIADPAAVRRHVEAVSGVGTDGLALAFDTAGDLGERLRVGRGDVFLATWWPTAHLANAALRLTDAPAFVYLVQDFEPGFYPWSTNHALVLETYRFPHRTIYNESLLRDYFATTGIDTPAAGDAAPDAASSIAFEPAVDRGTFRPGALAERPTLLFYARPRNPRNAFELGLRALRRAVAEGSFDARPWRFLAIGDQIPELPLGHGFRLERAPWLPVAGYGELLGSSDVLLSLMVSPHTSYPPLEMAAAGGRVVTNTFGPKTAAALRAMAPSIEGVPADELSLAEALGRAARRPRRDAAMPAPQLGLPGTWDEALDPVVDWLVALLDDGGAALRPGGSSAAT